MKTRIVLTSVLPIAAAASILLITSRPTSAKTGPDAAFKAAAAASMMTMPADQPGIVMDADEIYIINGNKLIYIDRHQQTTIGEDNFPATSFLDMSSMKWSKAK